MQTGYRLEKNLHVTLHKMNGSIPVETQVKLKGSVFIQGAILHTLEV